MHHNDNERTNVRIPLLIAGLIAGIFILTGATIAGDLGSVFKKSLTNPKSAPVGESLSPIADEERIVGIIEKANAAVVSVVATKDVPVLERYYEEFQPFGPGGGVFRVPRVRQQGTEEREVGGGSGFIVSPDGLIVTNRHVVSDEDAEFSVLLPDGKDYPARVVARDSVIDIAILKIDANRTFPYLSFADSDQLRLGQTTIAIGNALGEFRNSVSVGVISGLSRSIIAGDYESGESEQLSDVIQTDAAINPGNSGGPLLDSKGKVLGVNVAVALGSENIGFALPGNAVKLVVDSVKDTGEIVRPYLGVRYEMTTHENAPGSETRFGALIVEGGIVPGSPAEKVGLQSGDIIRSVDAETLDKRTLSAILQRKKVGQEVELRVLREGVEMKFWVTLERLPNDLD